MNSLARLRYLIATALTLTTGVIYAQSSPAAAHSAEGPAVTESVQACIEKVRPHPPETRRPCHIRGHALLAAGIIGRGGSFLVHDGTGGVFVRHRAPLDVSRGDLVEVRGEIYFDQDTELEIRASEVVRLGPGRELEPRDLTPAEVLSGEHNGELVRIRAVVTNTSISKNLVVVRLGDERLRTYWVPDRGAADLARIPTIELGAVVEVRGIARPRQRARMDAFSIKCGFAPRLISPSLRPRRSSAPRIYGRGCWCFFSWHSADLLGSSCCAAPYARGPRK